MNNQDLISEPIEQIPVPETYHKLADDLRDEECDLGYPFDVFPTYLAAESKFYPKSW